MMSFAAKITRFAHKPLPDKWKVVTATMWAASPRLHSKVVKAQAERRAKEQKLHRALTRIKAEELDFHSGLGDSAALLYGLARSIKPEICVEIGSAHGKSACYVGMALKENGFGRLFAIDPHGQTEWNDPGPLDSLDIFRTNVAALEL